jgi:L-alanine-DL-glutamate epimerase-like enolase superfamily enzyme
MTKPTDITILEARCSFHQVPFRSPLKFGGRVMDKGALINVEVRVESRKKRQEVGLGSMPVAPVWAWPSTAVSVEQAEEAMKRFAQEVIELAADYPDYEHPLDISEQLAGEYAHTAQKIAQRMKLPEPIPHLAQLVAASPLDAALHDAYGRVHGQNSYNLLSSQYMNHDLSEYLDAGFKGEYLDKYTLREPKPRLPLYHLVGALDPLTDADVATRVNDGLPETLGAWITYNGLTHLKIKLNGDDLKWDVDRVLAVDAVATPVQQRRGCQAWYYSLDFNEKCANVGYVLDFLGTLRERNPFAYDRIQYIEQPTHRDLAAHPENRMHEAAKLKPVVADESLVDYDSLLLARDLGYSGIALKACKGHGESLLLAAAGQKFGMFLCVQDLTCPGFSFLHSASLAARIPGVAAIEGNGRQYCPAENRTWRARFPGMFDIKDGTVGTAALNGAGLGF